MPRRARWEVRLEVGPGTRGLDVRKGMVEVKVLLFDISFLGLSRPASISVRAQTGSQPRGINDENGRSDGTIPAGARAIIGQ